MLILCLGLALFIAPHTLRELGLRDTLVTRLGLGGYKGLYSVVSLLGLALIVYGKTLAPFVQLWQPAFELRWISLALMIPSLILIVAGNLPAGGLKTLTGHPMLLGIVLWALAHLWANGDVTSLLLFASLGLWAGIKFSLLPHATRSGAGVWDAIAVIGGLSGYALLFLFHGQLFGAGLSM